MNGQVDQIKRVDENEKSSNNTKNLFLIDVRKYSTNHLASSVLSKKECIQVYAKRIILAKS